MTNIQKIGTEVLDIARKHGCEAMVTMVQSDFKELEVREGKIEQLLSSNALSTGIRLFKDNKSAIVSFSGDNFDNLEGRIKVVLDVIGHLGEDSAKRLLLPREFEGEPQELQLADQAFDTLDTGAAAEVLKNIEKTGLAVSKRMCPFETAAFSASRSHIGLFSTRGLRKSYDKSYYSYSYNAVAEDDNGTKEVDSWYENKRSFEELSDPALLKDIGVKAAGRALKRLGGKNIPSGERPVVFTYRTAGALLELLGDALDGEEILVRNSFLVDRLGEALFPKHITVVDDPLRKGYIGSYPFDGEGMNGRVKSVIDKGKVTGFLHNSYSATKLNMPLTGNASRGISQMPHIAIGNFYLQSGKGTQEDLVNEMKDGLLVDDLFVSGMNAVTGNFSFGCSGFLVENGKVTVPVKEITIAGNILELFQNVVAVGDDNLFKRSCCSPSILVSKLSVAGT